MDNRLVLTVLFVTLSWISVGTYAQSTTTMSTSMTNATMATVNMTSAPNTTMATVNMTSAPNTTMATVNMTSAPNTTMATVNMTSAPNATMATNMTTAAGNNTTMAVQNATMATNMTTAAGNNTTMAPQNMTTAAGNNTTAAPNTTPAPPLTPNTTVEVLQTPLSRTGCGTQQLCAAQPSDCDPGSGSCFFLSAKQQSGQNFEFGLSGEAAGYIAASLSLDSTLGGNDTTYVCANNNGVVKFFSTVLDNGQLIERELNVNSVKGSINGSTIQCTFAATVPTPETRATTNYTIGISTGSFNSTSGTLGNPMVQLRSNAVDLASPSTAVTNEISPNATTTPMTSMTTSHAITLQQSLTQALLITVGVLGLAMH